MRNPAEGIRIYIRRVLMLMLLSEMIDWLLDDVMKFQLARLAIWMSGWNCQGVLAF